MRCFLPLLLALSASYTTVTALPRPHAVEVRAPALQPRYSVVPLEPSEDGGSDGSGGSSDSGHGKGKGKGKGEGKGKSPSGILTVVKTVVKSDGPQTEVVTKTEAATVTAPGHTIVKSEPTTISIIDIEGAESTSIVLVTPLASVPASEPATTKAAAPAPKKHNKSKPANSQHAAPKQTTSTTSSTTSTSAAQGHETTTKPAHVKVPPAITNPTPATTETEAAVTTTTVYSEPSRLSQGGTSGEKASSTETTSTAIPTTATHTYTGFSTLLMPTLPPKPSAEAPASYDDGQWHTTYPAWNGTAPAQ